jgi:hypothetical protein
VWSGRRPLTSTHQAAQRVTQEVVGHALGKLTLKA